MELEELYLRKEEIPISPNCYFQVPIYPRLLDPSLRFSSELGTFAFTEAVSEWYSDMKDFRDSGKCLLKYSSVLEYFLEEEPKIIEGKDGRLLIKGLEWYDNFSTDERGFVNWMTTERNTHGTIFYNPNDIECSRPVSLENSFGRFIQFSPEKMEEYSVLGNGRRELKIYSYHNTNAFPGAFLLRNWAIKYLNMALEDSFS